MKHLALFSGSALSTVLIAGSVFAQMQGLPPATGAEAVAPGKPAEIQMPNARDQKPAFANQTRAPQPAQMPKIAKEVIAEALPHLWAMEFLPDRRMLVTAKAGAMHIISEEGEAGPIYDNPQHDYTKRLLAAVPVLPQAAE